jgi:major type 1 subunit fimbrin (pilin)
MKQRMTFAAAITSMSVIALMSMNQAHAADGTITINGAVSDTTCSINGIASGSAANVTATLPTVTAGALATAGATAGTSNLGDIKLSLTGCSGTATKAVARFENGATVDQSSGYLINQASASPATNVQVRLLNQNMQPINITTNANNDIVANGAAIAGNAATLNYFAQYYATGKATAGSVNTSVLYTMQYQ